MRARGFARRGTQAVAAVPPVDSLPPPVRPVEAVLPPPAVLQCLDPGTPSAPLLRPSRCVRAGDIVALA